MQLLKFSPRKTDAQLDWGKEVNGLRVAITPAGQKDKFFLRWKNVGKDFLTIPWMRLNSHLIDKHADDLLGHVLLKGPDGKLAPARQYPAPGDFGQFIGISDVVLGPGQTHEEIIDLWAYVEKPAADGRYQLSIQLDTPKGRRGLEFDAKSWTGRIESNAVEIQLVIRVDK